MTTRQFCFLIIIGTWWATVAVDMRLYPIITHYEFRGNDKYINSSIVVLGNNPLTQTYLLEFYVLRTIRDSKILLTISVGAVDGVSKNALFSRLVDGCEFIRRPSSDRLIKAFYDEIKKYSKIPQCPYQPGDAIVMNITPYKLNMPSFVPETECLFDVKTYTKARTELIFDTQWYGTMTRRENVRKVLNKAHKAKPK